MSARQKFEELQQTLEAINGKLGGLEAKRREARERNRDALAGELFNRGAAALLHGRMDPKLDELEREREKLLEARAVTVELLDGTRPDAKREELAALEAEYRADEPKFRAAHTRLLDALREVVSAAREYNVLESRVNGLHARIGRRRQELSLPAADLPSHPGLRWREELHALQSLDKLR